MFSRSWSTVGHFVPLCAKRLDCELFFVRLCIWSVRQGEWRAGWHRYIFALPNDTNTISWLSEQIESHSLFVSLTLCPCLSVSPSCTHFITLSSHRHITCAFICYRTLMCYTHPGGCCLIAFGSAVCQCWTWNLSVYPFSSHRGQCVS